MKRNFRLIVLTLVLFPVLLLSQGTYYDGLDPTSPSFISDLQNVIRSPFTHISYDQYDETMITEFTAIDNGDGTHSVFCVYTNYEYVYTGTFTWLPMSREHTFCHSWMPTYPSQSGNEYSDQHMLFPVNQDNANSPRSNHPLGIVVNPTFTFMEGKLGTDIDGNTVYEPRDEFKGNVARALFYAVVMYDGTGGSWKFDDINAHLVNDLGEAAQDVDLLLSWHFADPPDAYDVARNDYVQSIQQNRNPFVDHPEYVNYIDFNTLTPKTVDLFISEYVEGSSNNKALEIYNGTGLSVDLSNYSIDIYANGSSTVSATIPLTGTLVDQDVFVVVNTSADAALLSYADMTGNCYWNGNDAIILSHLGDPIDRVGQVGNDPGTEWGTGDVTTKDHTLRRKAAITDGDPAISDPFDPATEWDGYPQDTFDGLGSHIINTSAPLITNVSRTPTVPYETQNTVVTCDVTETAKAITAVDLFYSLNSGSYTSVAMTPTTGNQYSGEIPASAYGDGDYVEYYVHAVNDAGGESNSSTSSFFAGVTPIAMLHVVDGNGVLLYNGVYARAEGDATVADVTFSTSSLQVYFQDSGSGINIYKGGSPATFQLGRIYEVIGQLSQYNGLAELVPDNVSTDIDDQGPGTTPEPLVMTIAQFLADPEPYEGMLIGIQHVVNDGTGDPWPASGSNANLTISDGTGTMTMRIDKDTDIDENSEPSWPMDVVGILNQYDSSSPYTEGYQLLPRNYTDFLPNGSLPVELTSFSASVEGISVTLNWETASELNNKGFEIQRTMNNEQLTMNNWEVIGFVEGHGTTTEVNKYSFIDKSEKPNGTYYYRLKQIDNDGSYEYSGIVEVEVNNIPKKYSLEQNYPNPFNPSTVIEYSIPEKGFVTLKIYDILGNEIVTLVNNEKEAGNYDVKFDASQLTSGIYIYSIQVNDFRATKKMMLLK